MRYLIAGLGNADEEYTKTRHNAGFMVLDYISEKERLIFEPARYCFIVKHRIKNKLIYFIKPTTYMNNGGKAVRYWLNYLQLPIANLLVIVDDIALPTGKIRLKAKGSDGGHNGLNSIIYHLGTEEFARLRIGIGDEFSRGRQVDFVLGEWEDEELDIFKPKLPLIYKAVKNFVLEGVEKTMSKFNE